MMLRRFISCCLLAFAPVQAGAEVALSASEKGIEIGTGAMGSFLLPTPDLVFKGGRTEKGVFQQAKRAEALGSATYPSGASLEYSAPNENGQLNLRFSKMPTEAKSLRFTMNVPIRFNQGGFWAFDEAEPRAIPSKMGEQFVQAGSARSFHVISPMGEGISIQTPGGWQALQDNRVFNWQVYSYIYQFDLGGRQEGYFHFVIKDRPKQNDAPKFLVDRFGQSALRDYATKVKAESELREEARSQKKESRSPTAPALDEYGGLAGSGAEYGLKKTGFFHAAKVGKRDVLVTPAGNLFFHNGVCTLRSVDDYTTVKGRERIYEEIPDKKTYASAWRANSEGIVSFYIANWIRKYGKPYTHEEWLGQTIDRLRAWGFNSCGSFSGFSTTFAERNFPYVMNLGVESTPGVQALPGKIGAGRILDPFAPGTEEALTKHYSGSLAARSKEPLIIGYYLGNEQHFESLPKLIPSYKSDVAAKVKLVSVLEEKYGSIDKFNEAWKPKQPFGSFKELEDAPLFVATERAASDMREYFRLYLETYYGMVERAFRKNDPNHMIIGSRWTPGTASNEDVVRIGGKHVDVVSVNYYTYAIEPAFLERVHQWSGGKPMILSEWHFSATDHGLAGSREVGSQEERGLAYRNYIEQSASLPFVVGSEWFSYLDQSITGRFFEGFNGEGNNIGLVSVVDRPYPEFVSLVQFTNERIYDVMLGKAKAFAYDDPRFSGANANGERVVSIPTALPEMKLDGTTTGWPGRPAEPIAANRLALGTANPNLRGDFRLCWDAANLYFYIQVKDSTPGLNLKENANLWLGDAVELFVGGAGFEQRGSPLFSDRHIQLGAGAIPRVYVSDHPEENERVKILAVKDVTGDGYVVQCAIPWEVLGIEPASGKEFRFDVAIDNSDDGLARKQQLVWNGNAKNSADRGLWGKARLTDN